MGTDVPGRTARIVIEPVDGAAKVPPPHRATAGSAGFDLYAAEAARLTRTAVTLVRTGYRIRVPRGTFLEVRPRSGLSTRGVLMANAPGTIDHDFSGEVKVPLTYLFEGHYDVRAGDRIAQVRLVDDRPARFVLGRVEVVASRTGGFGSTGR